MTDLETYRYWKDHNFPTREVLAARLGTTRSIISRSVLNGRIEHDNNRIKFIKDIKYQLKEISRNIMSADTEMKKTQLATQYQQFQVQLNELKNDTE